MIKRYGDGMAGVAFLLLTAWYYQGTFIRLKFRLSRYGAEFVPRIYCMVMAAVAVGLIVRCIVRARAMPETEEKPVNWPGVAKVFLSILLIAGYIAVMRPVGFVVSTAVYLALQVAITAPRGRVRPLSVLVFAVGVACLLNCLFLHVFYLALPPGIFTF